MTDEEKAEALAKLKRCILESDYPYFDDATLTDYLEDNNWDVRAAAYQCLILKSENTTLNLTGLDVANSSSYFRRIARQYKPNNSGTLRGVY